MIIKNDLSSFLYSKLGFFKVVSITGAGGKTTLLNLLGRIFGLKNEKVMLTTTTHLAKNCIYSADEIITGPLTYNGSNSVLYISTDTENPNKYKSPGEKFISNFSKYFNHTFIEADGSNTLPLKYHSEKDPVIISDSQFLLSIIGLDGFAKRIDDVMHNADKYFDDFPDRKCRRVDFCDYLNLINSKDGAFKGANRRKSILFLNKIDLIDDVNLLKRLVDFSNQTGCILSSFEKNYYISDNII